MSVASLMSQRTNTQYPLIHEAGWAPDLVWVIWIRERSLTPARIEQLKVFHPVTWQKILNALPRLLLFIRSLLTPYYTRHVPNENSGLQWHMYFTTDLISTMTNWVHASVCVWVKIDKVNHYVEFSLYITFADAWVAANMTVCKKHQSIQVIRVQSQSSLKPLWLWIKAAVQDIKNATSLTHTTQYIWFYIKGSMIHRILNKHTIVNSSVYLGFLNCIFQYFFHSHKHTTPQHYASETTRFCLQVKRIWQFPKHGAVVV